MTAFTIFTAAASLLLGAGTIHAGEISPSPDPAPPGEKINLLTKYNDVSLANDTEAANDTEELEFDWVVTPPGYHSSLPESGKTMEKNMRRKNSASTPSINWIMKIFPATSTSRLKDLIEQFLAEMDLYGHQVREMTKHVQVGSTTEELEFDWVVVPFTAQEHRASLPRPVKELDAENGN